MSFYKMEKPQKNLNFKVESELLDLAYQGDAKALHAIAEQALREQRFGLAKNFFRLADEQKQKAHAID